MQAMNTGHDGSLSTGHANSCKDMLSRLETMVLMGMELAAFRDTQSDCIGDRYPDPSGKARVKSRKVLKIVEIAGMEQGEVMLHELFRYEESGEEARHVRGTLMRTGRLMHTEKCERAGMNPEKEGSSGL